MLQVGDRVKLRKARGALDKTYIIIARNNAKCQIRCELGILTIDERYLKCSEKLSVQSVEGKKK